MSPMRAVMTVITALSSSATNSIPKGAGQFPSANFTGPKRATSESSEHVHTSRTTRQQVATLRCARTRLPKVAVRSAPANGRSGGATICQLSISIGLLLFVKESWFSFRSGWRLRFLQGVAIGDADALFHCEDKDERKASEGKTDHNSREYQRLRKGVGSGRLQCIAPLCDERRSGYPRTTHSEKYNIGGDSDQ